MKLLDQITVEHQGQQKYVELYYGDLSKIPNEQAVDILVISAFPGSYRPMEGTLIKALEEVGVSTKELAADKAVDLRQHFSCWLSKEISDQNFRKILCFEPPVDSSPTDQVGGIFQSLMPFVFQDEIKSIAMPIVATGLQGYAVDTVLEPLVEAAVNWLATGLPIERIKIVEYDLDKTFELLKKFVLLKQKYNHKKQVVNSTFKYDLFISYSHRNSEEIHRINQHLQQIKPDLRIFLDKKDLKTGVAWQQELYDALDQSRKIVCFLSEPYLESKVCKEEFNIAVFRHREESNHVLLPVYLYSTKLPTYIKLLQFDDCRENDIDKLNKICTQIAASI